MMKPKVDIALILKKSKPSKRSFDKPEMEEESKMGEEQSYEEEDQAAQTLIDGIKSGDTAKVLEGFKSLMKICEGY